VGDDLVDLIAAFQANQHNDFVDIAFHAGTLTISRNTKAVNSQRAPLTRKTHAHAWRSIQFLMVLFMI
ncbi:hypothetical protein JBO49_03240, partial [Serratia fonticola]|uniref:hypothetical protein n=1 Tax=Serratia fonticola TaxID=47917 RepID=UPI00192A9409